MKLGFFGGSFNPPTYAHMQLLKDAKNSLNLDKVYFVPVGDNYKKQGLVNEKHRYEMLKLMCGNEENIEVEGIELNNKNRITAIQAFEMIKGKYSNEEIYFIMGADNFIKIPMWDSAEKLIKNFKYIIFRRDNINIEQEITNNKLLQENKNNFKILNISKFVEYRSSIIRNLVQNKEYDKAKEYTKREIIDYIKENNLYI